MILQVIDGGRFERIAIRGVPSREIEGREYIGGYRLDGALDEIWFDKDYWDITQLPPTAGADTYLLVRKAS